MVNGIDFGTAIGLIKGIGSPDPAVIESAVNGWLDDHPEATTTVQDGSITKAKLDSNLQGTVDDVADLKSQIGSKLDSSVVVETEQNTLLSWELGAIDRNTGNNQNNSAYIRSRGYELGNCESFTITPESTYIFATRAYKLINGAYVYDANESIQFAQASPATIAVKDGYSYRICISNTSGTTASIDYANHVSIATVPKYNIERNTKAVADTVLYPSSEIIKLPSEVTFFQNFEKVGSEIWFIRESTGNVGTTLDGIIYRVNAETYEYIKTSYHNFGHPNNISYDADNDRLLFSLSDDKKTDNHRYFYIVENISQKTGNINLAECDYVAIDFDDLKNVYGSLSYSDACWGGFYSDSYKTVWLQSNLCETLFHIRLGIGDEELEYGTYVASESYNGTFTVLESYQTIGNRSILNDAVCQGLSLFRGKILTSNGHTPCTGALWTPHTSKYTTLEKIEIPYGSGSNEGVAVIDGSAFLGVANAGESRLFKLIL